MKVIKLKTEVHYGGEAFYGNMMKCVVFLSTPENAPAIFSHQKPVQWFSEHACTHYSKEVDLFSSKLWIKSSGFDFFAFSQSTLRYQDL